MEQREVIRLLNKEKTGIMRIIFSRAILIALLLVLEIFLLLSAFKWFFSYFAWITGVQTVFVIIMVLYLFNSKMDASAKLTWLFLIMLFPIPTAIFLWISTADIGHRFIIKKFSNIISETKDFIPVNEEVLMEPSLVESGTDDLCRYVNRSGDFPICMNTEVTYLPLGEKKLEVLLEELKKAEKFIYLEYFIINEGLMWGQVLKILADKAKEGVDVRVMYDGMCEVALLTHDYPKRMAKLGIKCKPFTPITPFFSTQYNYRDHRKVLVIDGKVAFNGGVNMSDEYINHTSPFGHWKDVAVMLKGEAVQSFTLMFLQMWNLDEKDHDWTPALVSDKSKMSDGYVMPYCDCPLDGDKVGENVYLDILYRARDYVHIMTPYLIIDNEIERALIYAAKRGVDVKILLPGKPDKILAYALAATHYKALINAGVKIYEYTPGFVHAKVFVSDNEKAVVGTINLDYRSLYHHFECGTYLYKVPCVSEIEKDYEDTLTKCREVTLQNYKKDKRFYRILGSLVKVIAPLM